MRWRRSAGHIFWSKRVSHQEWPCDFELRVRWRVSCRRARESEAEFGATQFMERHVVMHKSRRVAGSGVKGIERLLNIFCCHHGHWQGESLTQHLLDEAEMLYQIL